ncbi:MFS transporter [Candidatus Borrarchaeum sp.]|uniref:MFS transporter n=1 Tax=Candidatus Borrarchaeum sp. TaxID=2846742 RepID=UPI00257B7DDF|nr:MFS transporter [Candidatus Borrarchaeum sp.]
MNDDEIKKYALIVATMAGFLTPFMGSAVNIALPTIANEYGMDAVLLSWVATAYLLAAAIFLVSIGRIADIYGRKKVFSIGIFIYTLSAILSANSPSGEWLVAFRFIEGFGASMIFGTGVAILTSVFPPGERGKALGINVAAVYFGLSVGPFLGGFLTQQFGWRSVFLSNVPLGAITLIFIFWKFKGKEWAEAEGEKFDYTGSILWSVMLIAIMYGLSLLPAIMGAWLILAGFLGLTLFIFWELKVEHPILDVTLFRTNRVFTFSNMAALINYSATFAVGFLLSLYLQYIKNFSPLNAGMILLAQPVMQAIFSPFAGKLSDRIEPRIVASSGMTLIVVGLSIFAFILSETTALEFIIASLCLLGLGFALFSSPNTNAIMSSVEKKCYGVASGMVGTMRLIGQLLSMATAMLLFNLFIGRVQITPENYPLFLMSVQVAFIIFVILCIVGVFASLVRGKLRDEELTECKLPGN